MSARLAACAALGVLCLLQLLCMVRAPAAWSPSAIDVSLQKGEALVLGQAELATPQAKARQLLLRRDGAGQWWLRNLSSARPLLLQGEDGELRAGSVAPRTGQQFQIGARRFAVLAASPREVTLADGAREWRFDGASLLRDGQLQPPCPEVHLLERAIARWNGVAPATLTLARALTFGGNLDCGNRIGLAQLAPGSAALARSGARLLLAANGGQQPRSPVLLSTGDGPAVELAQQESALAGVHAIVAGHTRLALAIVGQRIELRPSRQVALFAQPQATLAPQVNWRWQQRALWALPASPLWWLAGALCALLAARAALAWQRGPRPSAHGAASALLVVAGITGVLLQRAGTPPGAAISMLLAWGALWCWLLVPGRATLAGTAATLLLAAGLLAQLEMGLGAPESSWLRYFQKTAALLAFGLGAALQLRLHWRAAVPQSRVEWMLAALAACALGALLLQVLFGDETGVFDLQPVEFAKLALSAVSAHCIAVGMGWQTGAPRRRWLRLVAPALLFGALLALALIEVDDYSPLVLLMVWSTAMALAWSLAARQRGAVAAVLLLGCVALGAIAGLRGAGADGVAQWGFYADRFLVWLDPASHPHTGQQMLAGARAIAEGGWWGADQWLGLASLGQGAGSVLRIPAVQDDFAPSFFLNRHGLAAALALWGLQALLLCGLLQTAARALAASTAARDYRQAWRGRFHCFALCGGAAFLLGHFLLSWGTNLAIFPVMGQPMSFLSAGGSHLLFFICPLLALNAISAQTFEENSSCRSMSNMKY
ncbi:MAG: FtsW/RodA/SpoVE family cell cycle protein [Pseudomonadota bacterium]